MARFCLPACLAFASSIAFAQTPVPDAAPFDAPAAMPLPAHRVTWSEVTGMRYPAPAKDRAAAVIRRIDGRYAAGEARVKIAPGIRDVVVQSPSRHGFGGTERHFRLQAEPCRRYYVNAQFRGPTGIDWTPVVAKSEPIVGCRMPASGR